MSSDYNMITALDWAYKLGSLSALPQSLSSDIEHRASVVKSTNIILLGVPVELKNVTNTEKQQRLDSLRTKSATLLSDVSEGNARSNVLLRLWSGCLMASKIIALDTVDCPNTREKRAKNFIGINSWIPNDHVFAAGVEAAPAFKKLQKENYSFDGVPADSVVRKYPNEYLV
jgi:hypothetical protein